MIETDTIKIHIIKTDVVEFIEDECGEKELLTLATSIRKMSKPVAQQWIRLNKPSWPQWVVDEMLLTCRETGSIDGNTTTYADKMVEYEIRRQFCAAAWCLGASWHQMGDLFGSSRASIQASTIKVLPSAIRDTIVRPRISLERLSDLLSTYKYILSEIDRDTIRRMTPMSLAALITETVVRTVGDTTEADEMHEGIQSRIPSKPPSSSIDK